MTRNFFIVRVTLHWNRQAREGPPHWIYSKLSGHNLAPCALGWTRWPTIVPSNLTNSAILWYWNIFSIYRGTAGCSGTTCHLSSTWGNLFSLTKSWWQETLLLSTATWCRKDRCTLVRGAQDRMKGNKLNTAQTGCGISILGGVQASIREVSKESDLIRLATSRTFI